MSDSDVIRMASKVNTAGIDAAVASDVKKKTFMESDITPEIRQSYQPLMKKLLPPYKPGETVDMVVKKNYEMVDAQLIKCLVEKRGDGEGSEEVRPGFEERSDELRMRQLVRRSEERRIGT